MIHVERLSKSYHGKEALSETTFAFQAGKCYAVLGKSGCGKSTLLNLLSGLETPSSGTVYRSPSISLSYVFQSYPLLPWRSVNQNLQLGAEMRGELTDPTQVTEYLRAVGLEDVLDKYPNELSGGMRQRVALIQSLLSKPTVLLLDEPFSSLDFELKLCVQRMLSFEKKRFQRTMIVVTHDIEDAIALADEIIILGQARGLQHLTVPATITQLEDPLSSRTSPEFPSIFNEIRRELGW